MNHSGRTFNHSGRTFNHSGRTFNHSGRTFNHSGKTFIKPWSKSNVFQNKAKIICKCAKGALQHL